MRVFLPGIKNGILYSVLLSKLKVAPKMQNLHFG